MKRYMAHTWVILEVLAGIAGCSAHYALVQPGTRDMDGFYRIHTPVAWSAYTQDNMEVWTINGPLLERLVFYKGVQPGAILLQDLLPVGQEVPYYKANMRAHDIIDLVLESYEMAGSTHATLQALHPTSFGHWPGFHFEFDLSIDGLAYKGLGLGAIDEEHLLHLILYIGTREHYFNQHREVIEYMFSSVDSRSEPETR
jgi:hypothetical protein